ncbi:MarR family winged helix-turn-helix transcriptional regulator [Mucilaginibacter sp. FT3.2]|uniref:MarR family winged helix-turn-helix transcriptional regulator n=1 Tax=Mucilaginibacter sp. FT3.2 TaxID=2723090 RepID=UPI00161C7985|nr:helix-turn-helix domain-containing protein [Mucilaginibacter sp. FT3.2]MBB6233318.1 DNA-binding MarR family transcriptional regulator [Mucilaginibacter sp. FT3.2]
MNLYQRLGYLVLGSRLRRISESFLSEINRAYQQEGIEFEASWFPVFYLLSQHDTLSIKELSDQTEVSHPAASQLITNLKNRGLLVSTTSVVDARRQQVTFSPKGRGLLEQIKPVWAAVEKSMNEMMDSELGCKELLPAITALESALQSYPLSNRIGRNINNQAKNSKP